MALQLYPSPWCWLDLLGFFFKLLLDTCPFLGPLIPLFQTSGDVSSGFQSQSGQPYSSLAEAYVLHLGLLLVLLLGHSARLLFGRTCNLYKDEPSLLLFLWVSVDERFLFIFTFFVIIAQGNNHLPCYYCDTKIISLHYIVWRYVQNTGNSCEAVEHFEWTNTVQIETPILYHGFKKQWLGKNQWKLMQCEFFFSLPN